MDAPAATRVLLRLSLVCLLAAALVAIAALLAGELDDPEDRILLAAAAIALYNATASAGVSLLARVDLSLLGTVTIGVSGFALVFALLVIADDFDDGLAKPWGIATAAALALTQASVLLGRLREDDVPIVRATTLTTVVSGGVLATIAVGAILTEDPGDDGWRFIAVIAIVNVLAMLLTPILRRLSGATETRSVKAPGPVDAVMVGNGRLEAELARLRAAGGEIILAPVPLRDGGRLAAVRTAGGTRVLIEGAP